MEHTLELTPRLRAAAELVPEGARLADVGTDHGYLPAWLLLRGRIDSAIAADLRPGPLDRARQTAARYGLTEQMDFRLCDGLSAVSPGEADAVVIAGMGGETIAAILSAAPWVREAGCPLILQPMSAQPFLRRWLQANGYAVEREVLAREGETLYTIFLAKAGPTPPLTPAEAWAGRQSREEADPLRGAYLDKLLLRASRARDGARASGRAEDLARARTFDDIYHSLTELKKEWDTWQR